MKRPNITELRRVCDPAGTTTELPQASDILELIAYAEYLEGERIIDKRVISASVWFMDALDHLFIIARLKAIGGEEDIVDAQRQPAGSPGAGSPNKKEETK